MVNERRWLLLIFSLYVLFAAGYSLLMPIWEAPDEPAHYHLAWHLSHYDEYPSPEVNYEAHQPRGYYYLSSSLLSVLEGVDPRWTRYIRPREHVFNIRTREARFEWTDKNYRFVWGVYLLRWVNIILGGVALWLNWKAFRLLSPAEPALCLAALALAALTPQYLHIASSVNNDVLGTLAGALLLYLALRLLVQPTFRAGLLSIALAILLPLVTKLTVLPVSAAVLAALVLRWLPDVSQKRWLIYAGIMVGLGAGVFYLLFPEAVQSAASEIRWRLFSLRKNALTEEYIRTMTSQVLWTYWGKVGWLAVGLPLGMIQLLTGLGVTGMILQMYSLIRGRAHGSQRALWLAIWLVAIFTLLAVFRNGLTTFATQGRLLFPAIGALSVLMIAGWHDLLPERARRYLPLSVTLLFLSCNLVLWLTGIIPVYYQPFFD